MTGEAALDYFMTNWAQIGQMTAKTPPANRRSEVACRRSGYLRAGFENHEARAIRRTSSMTDAA